MKMYAWVLAALALFVLASGPGVAMATDDTKMMEFTEVDSNGDGMISMDEYSMKMDDKAKADKTFKEMDENGDGKISQDEWDKKMNKKM